MRSGDSRCPFILICAPLIDYISLSFECCVQAGVVSSNADKP